MKDNLFFWAALAVGIAFGVAALAVSLRPPKPVTASEATSAMASSASPSTEEAALQRCQLMAQPDGDCRRLWAENRRHFLGLDKPSVSRN
jgi:conjugative transfer region protein TrbK